LPKFSIIGHVAAGMIILGEKSLEGYPEIDRLVGGRSNPFSSCRSSYVRPEGAAAVAHAGVASRKRQTIGGMPMDDETVAGGPEGQPIPPRHHPARPRLGAVNASRHADALPGARQGGAICRSTLAMCGCPWERPCHSLAEAPYRRRVSHDLVPGHRPAEVLCAHGRPR
jgi:hypothetical protein